MFRNLNCTNKHLKPFSFAITVNEHEQKMESDDETTKSHGITVNEHEPKMESDDETKKSHEITVNERDPKMESDDETAKSQNSDKRIQDGNMPTCPICKKTFTRAESVCRHVRTIHGLGEKTPEMELAREQKIKCHYCKRFQSNLSVHYKTCVAKKQVDELTPEKPTRREEMSSRHKTDDQIVDMYLQFAMSKDGGECKKNSAENYARQVWKIIKVEKSENVNFRARHWFTSSSNFKQICKASKYLEAIEMSRSQQQQLLCAYALLCKFLESKFYDLKDVIDDYGGKMAHVAAMRDLQRTQLKTLRKSLFATPLTSTTRIQNQSTLDELTDAFKDSELRVALVKQISKGQFSVNKGAGIHCKRNFGHFLATTFHLWGAGNRWDVTENLKVRDVENAKPCPKRCGACGEHKVDFEYHLKKHCPDGKIFYQTNEQPKSKGYLVHQNSHKTEKTRGEMVTRIPNYLRKAILNYAKYAGLNEGDLAFPADLQTPNKGMKFWRHGRPIIHALCPELTEKAESEYGGNLASNFIRKKGMTDHVLANVPEACERLGGSAKTARKNYLCQDMMIEERINDSIRVVGDIPESGRDTDSEKNPEKTSRCPSTATKPSETCEGKAL